MASLAGAPARAIEQNGGLVTTPPTSADIPHWNTGWGNANVTGWNYVGSVNGFVNGHQEFASGVYVGNGWVLTAGHIGPGDFTLGGVVYTPYPAAYISFPDSNGTADLCLFAINSPPNLPGLIISTSAPTAFSATKTGSMVAMLGIGGNMGLTWGLDTVTEINEALSLLPPGETFTFNSHDFFTDNGTVTRGSSSITNNSMVISGDSGGGDFIYNTATTKWELAGINEADGSFTNANGNPALGDGTFSAFVQLSTYATLLNAQIAKSPTLNLNSIDTPVLPMAGLVALGCLLCLAGAGSLKPKRCQVEARSRIGPYRANL